MNDKTLPTRYSRLEPYERKLVRDDYIQRQNGKCMYCEKSLYGPPASWVTIKPINLHKFSKGFMGSPIHLQHCHKTDMTEGAVHAYCNAVMWEYDGR